MRGLDPLSSLCLFITNSFSIKQLTHSYFPKLFLEIRGLTLSLAHKQNATCNICFCSISEGAKPHKSFAIAESTLFTLVKYLREYTHTEDLNTQSATWLVFLFSCDGNKRVWMAHTSRWSTLIKDDSSCWSYNFAHGPCALRLDHKEQPKWDKSLTQSEVPHHQHFSRSQFGGAHSAEAAALSHHRGSQPSYNWD